MLTTRNCLLQVPALLGGNIAPGREEVCMPTVEIKNQTHFLCRQKFYKAIVYDRYIHTNKPLTLIIDY